MSYHIGTLIEKEKIEQRIIEMAETISKDYKGKNLKVIGILKGSVPFVVMLTQNMHDVNVVFDYMSCSSYWGGTRSTGVVKIVKDLDYNIEGEDVLIVEDIVDSGYTLSKLVEILSTRNPKSLRIATLLDKPDRRVADVHVDYTGFTIEDKFVVGYGLDYDQHYRNLPYIGEVIFDS